MRGRNSPEFGRILTCTIRSWNMPNVHHTGGVEASAYLQGVAMPHDPVTLPTCWVIAATNHVYVFGLAITDQLK